jgi:hypothetical protein
MDTVFFSETVYLHIHIRTWETNTDRNVLGMVASGVVAHITTKLASSIVYGANEGIILVAVIE